MAQIIAV